MKYIDAEKLKAELKRLIKERDNRMKLGTYFSTSYVYEDILALIDSLQQEQPEVDLEKKIEKEWEKLEKDYSPSALDKSYMIVSGLVGRKQFSLIARHFYELGLNTTKEENK